MRITKPPVHIDDISIIRLTYVRHRIMGIATVSLARNSLHDSGIVPEYINEMTWDGTLEDPGRERDSNKTSIEDSAKDGDRSRMRGERE